MISRILFLSFYVCYDAFIIIFIWTDFYVFHLKSDKCVKEYYQAIRIIFGEKNDL